MIFQGAAGPGPAWRGGAGRGNTSPSTVTGTIFQGLARHG